MKFNDDLINHIMNNIELGLKLKPGEIAVLNQGAKAIKLSENNFKIINRKTFQPESLSEVNFIAIDGGNSSIIETNSFILDFIKIATVEVKNKKTRSANIISGFISATYLKSNNSENSFIKYKVIDHSGNLPKYAPQKLELESIKPSPNELKDAINTIRKSIELNILKESCSKRNNTVILRDGSLISSDNSYEPELIQEIYSTCKTNKNLFFGISKDSLIYTNYGNHLTSLMYNIAKQKRELRHKEWFIKIGESSTEPRVDVFIALLNERAQISLRIDVFNGNTENLALLTYLSSYPAFLGYPYPLIVADKTARVSSEETRLIKQLIHRKVKNTNLKKLENFFNPHKFLDTIR